MSAEVIPLRPESRPPRARKKLGRAAERPYYFHQASEGDYNMRAAG
jgi:hypothetical protein